MSEVMVMEYMEQQMQNQIEAAENEREQMLCEIVKLEQNLEAVQAERDALAAQVGAIKAAWVGIGNWPDTVEDKIRLADAICATPTACLAQVRADVARTDYFQGYLEGFDAGIQPNAAFAPSFMADQYAERIRQEVK